MTIPPPGAAPTNRFARVALICALATLVLPLFIPAILGIVFAVVALVRAARLRGDGYPPIGRTMSLWALATGIFMLVYNVFAIWLVLNVMVRLLWILFGGSWNSPPSG